MRARRRDRTTAATPLSLDVPSTGGRHQRHVELIDSDSAVTFPIVGAVTTPRHWCDIVTRLPGRELNNLFGHAPHDRKDPIHSVSPAPSPGHPADRPAFRPRTRRARAPGRACFAICASEQSSRPLCFFVGSLEFSAAVHGHHPHNGTVFPLHTSLQRGSFFPRTAVLTGWLPNTGTSSHVDSSTRPL